MPTAEPSTPAPTYATARELEHALNGAVLAVGAVQRGEDDVVAAHRRVERHRELEALLDGDLGRVGVERDEPGISLGRLERALGLAAPVPELVYADEHGLEALAIEGIEDVARRQQGDLVLRRAAAEQDDDACLLHAVFPTSP